MVILAAIWGSSFLFARISVEEFGAIPLSAIRSAIAAMTLFPLMLWSGQWPGFIGNLKHFVVLGLTSTAVPFTCITLSTQFSTAGFASILNSLTPIMSASIAFFWLGERLSAPAVFGIGLSFSGVIIMITDTQSISSELIFLPVLAGLCAAFFYGLTGNYSRKYVHGVPPIAQATGCQVFAALFLLPPALLLWPDNSISTAGWTNAVILGLLCTGVAFILYFTLLMNIGVAKTVIVTYMIPVFAMLWGFLFLDETITLKMLAGTVFILTGIALTTGMVQGIRRRKVAVPYED